MRISIFSIYFLLPLTIFSNSLSIKLGVYDFTDDTAWSMYGLSPELLISTKFNINNILSWDITSGALYSSTEYHNNEHRLIVVPLYITSIINFPDIHSPSSTITPFIGAGLSGFYKRDETVTTNEIYDSFSYGYNLKIGLIRSFRKNINIIAELRFNAVMTHFFEENNTGGIITTLGIEYEFENND